MKKCARRLARSIRMTSLGFVAKPETSESSVIAYVTMIGSWCQRLGSRNLSRRNRILGVQDTEQRPTASNSGRVWCRDSL